MKTLNATSAQVALTRASAGLCLGLSAFVAHATLVQATSVARYCAAGTCSARAWSLGALVAVLSVSGALLGPLTSLAARGKQGKAQYGAYAYGLSLSLGGALLGAILVLGRQ